MSKNLAADCVGLSGSELRKYLEEKIDYLEEELIQLSDKYNKAEEKEFRN